MSAPAFTPGPWGCEQSQGDWLVTHGLNLHHGPRAIAKVFDHACEFQEADARLIASAPELYEALEALAALSKGLVGSAYTHDAEMALAKARGEQ